MPSHVVLGWATGKRGQVRIAFTLEEEPDSKRLQEARVAVTQNYRQVFYGGSQWSKDNRGEDDWPTPNVTVRDGEAAARLFSS